METDRKDLFRNKNIQKVINAMWFVNKQDDGVIYPEYFKPLPDVTIALVFNGVRPFFYCLYHNLLLMLLKMECGVDEWGTGIKTDVMFTTMEYRTMFDAHLKCLRNFQEATKKYELLDKICTKLYNVGRYVIILKPLLDRPSNFCLSFHSGTQPITPVITTAVSAGAFAAALKEYEENSETDSNREDGE
jgi:hypothetical protein